MPTLGWHVPTDVEWCTLENYVDIGTILCNSNGWRGTDAGANLKETGTTHWSFHVNGGATNSSGFTGLPGGDHRYWVTPSFSNLTFISYFWTSSEDGATYGVSRSLHYNSTQIGRDTDGKETGISVRCIKD